jgi:hypothetical protein
MYLTYQFSQIISCGTVVSDLAGYTSRLGQLMEALDMLSTEMENIAIDYPHEEALSMDSSIQFDNVTFSTPTGELIVTGKHSIPGCLELFLAFWWWYLGMRNSFFACFFPYRIYASFRGWSKHCYCWTQR